MVIATTRPTLVVIDRFDDRIPIKKYSRHFEMCQMHMMVLVLVKQQEIMVYHHQVYHASLMKAMAMLLNLESSFQTLMKESIQD